jgi:hypothetical protein
MRDPGVVDEHVDPAMARERPRDERLDVRLRETSAAMPSAPVIDAAAAITAASSRSASTTAAPSAAKRCAHAKPMPRARP